MDVFELRDRVTDDYARYMRSFIEIRDPEIEALVNRELPKLWPDPLIQINPAFEPGEGMDQLIADGILHFGHRATVDYAKAAKSAPIAAAADAPDLHSPTPLPDDPDSIRHLLAEEDPAITPDMIAVLRALRRADAPLGKTELLNAASLDTKRFTTTTNALLGLGLVAKTGRGRGTKYLAVK